MDLKLARLEVMVIASSILLVYVYLAHKSTANYCGLLVLAVLSHILTITAKWYALLSAQLIKHTCSILLSLKRLQMCTLLYQLLLAAVMYLTINPQEM